MPSAPVPVNEAERLAALRSLRVLDTPPDQGFDDLTSLARDALGLPTASISLVDEHRQWLKSSAGIDPAEAACDVPRSQSICAYVVRSAEPLVIDDLAADERTRDNPLVTGATGLRFYAGAPIVLSTGEAVGSFCVEDRRPNSLTEHQTAMLERFASAAASMLESRRAERALLEADHRLKSIQDAAPVGLLHLEAVRDHRTRVVDFRIADANSTARGLLSLPEPCVGSALAERVPAVREADGGAVWHAMLHTSASGDPTTVEAECGDRGRTLTLRWKFARLDCCVVASVEDVTAIRKAERVQSEREQLMRQFVQHTPVAVAMFDTTMRYLVASDKWYTDNGLPHQDLEGLHHYDVFPHLGDDWRSFHRRALNGESLSRERYCYEWPDGRTQWLRWQMYPWQHDDGTVGGIIVFTEDITARAEQDLIIERSRDLLEQTQAMSGVGGWSLDLTTGELHWTEQTFAIHGMSAAEGEPDVSRAIDKYAPEHRAMVREVVDRAANGTEPFDFEAEIIRTDGVHVPVRAIGCPVVQHGRVVRLVGAFQDLTRIRAEQEQRDRSLAMLRVMSEGTDDLIFVKDIKGRFLFANPAMAEFCGVAPGDMLGKTDDEVMPAHIAELCRSGDLKVLATGASTTFGEELPTPSGLRHYNTLKQPYRLSDGTVAGVITLCHDITEVREQEAESRRLREIIEAITDASSDVIFVKDREGKLIFCNPAFAEAVGRPIDELIGTTDYGHLDELSRDRIRETDERVMRTGEPVRVEERVVLAGLGEAERIFDSEKHPYRLPDGSIGGVIGVARDVTDFLRAVDEVRDTEARLSFALSAAGVGYWDHDVVSDRVEYADTWFTMLGYEPGEIPMTVECFWNDLLHPDDRAAVRAAHKAYLAGRTYSYDVQCRLKHKSGAWHWIRDIGSIIERDGDGRPTRMVGVHIDIDERERQHVMLQTALVAANEGLWEWIIPDNRCYFDDMWYRLLGYEPGELPMEFETWEALCHPQDIESTKLALGRFLRGEVDSYEAEHRLWTKQGTWKWVLGTGTITERDEQGRPVRVVGVNMDIDDRMRVAETLEHALDAAEAANLAKSRFLANMSHEIRTPMTAIVGYAELMANDDELLADRDRMRETAAIVQRNGEHLLTIINDILDISKIDAGKMTTESVRTNLRELVGDVYELHRSRATHKGIRLEIQQRDALPDAVMADPVRIRQVLMNLVNNAIKFTESGSVTLRMEVVESADTGDGAEERGGFEEPVLKLSVIDTGIGMSEEQVERLFSAFQQADDSMARRFGGTGLGLVISKRLAELMHGDVVVRSRLGGGSTFTLELPLALAEDAKWIEPGAEVEAASVATRDTKHSTPLSGLRVLLVEDGLDNQRLISHHLRKAGALVSIANNGEEGVSQIESWHRAGDPFDLVLMDMQMPVKDGYAAARELREGGESVPILALTAHAMTGDRERCLEAGCDAYETKPVARQRLIDVCLELVERRGRRAA